MFHIIIMQIRTTNWGMEKVGTCESWQRTEETRYGGEREREVALIIMDLFR